MGTATSILGSWFLVDQIGTSRSSVCDFRRKPPSRYYLGHSIDINSGEPLGHPPSLSGGRAGKNRERGFCRLNGIPIRVTATLARDLLRKDKVVNRRQEELVNYSTSRTSRAIHRKGQKILRRGQCSCSIWESHLHAYQHHK
jgi:hypothetical protein